MRGAVQHRPTIIVSDESAKPPPKPSHPPPRSLSPVGGSAPPSDSNPNSSHSLRPSSPVQKPPAPSRPPPRHFLEKNVPLTPIVFAPSMHLYRLKKNILHPSLGNNLDSFLLLIIRKVDHLKGNHLKLRGRKKNLKSQLKQLLLPPNQLLILRLRIKMFREVSLKTMRRSY